MIKQFTIIILLLSSIKAFPQQNDVKEFIILTFEMDRNKDPHGIFVYYWIAELEKFEKVDEYKEPKIYSVFLHEFYSRNQFYSCCLGKRSYPFDFFQGDNFEFPENYRDYLSGLRKLIKDNRIKIQEIKKPGRPTTKKLLQYSLELGY